MKLIDQPDPPQFLSLILAFLCSSLVVFQPLLDHISRSAYRGSRRHSDVGGVQAASTTCPPLEPSESSTLRKSKCDSPLHRSQ